MEPLPESVPSQRVANWTGRLFIGGALLVAFAMGLTISLWGRPSAPQEPAEKIVEVVVTATPTADNSGVAAQVNPQTGASTAAESAAKASIPTPTIMDFVLSDARHFQGSDDAPVTLIEFSDFKCPFCGRFSAETLPQIREQYINPGQVRFVYKHFAILGPESNRTAEATECAAEQGKFWEYHDRIFADQTSTRSTLNDDRLTTLAGEIGLDTPAFSECLASGRYASQISQESLTVQSMGLRGTPGFLINGVFISGAQPFEVFQQVIEEQLEAQ